MPRAARVASSFLLPCLAACSGDSKPAPSPGPWDQGTVVPADTQRAGDAAEGRERLLTEPYTGCGIPASVFPLAVPLTAQNTLPGRDGINADVPYAWNKYVDANGVEIVTQNCFTCHAGRLDGELILGL